MLGRTSDGARPHLTTRLCINSCIYLWPAIPPVFWAESNFRFRCYRTPETVSREMGVTAATLTGWHDAFLAAGEAALTSRAATGEELESERLKAKLGAALIERDLLNEKIALLEAGRPFTRRRRTP